MRISRRELLKAGGLTALGAGALGGLSRLARSEAEAPLRISREGEQESWTREARHYEKVSDDLVRCLLCPHGCEVEPGARGTCGVRENRGGVLHTVVYGRAASVNVDPVEKKPFFHVRPGSLTFSFSTAGCNMSCRNCQNWQLSQSRPESLPAADLPPKALVEAAARHTAPIISGTYSEPVVFFEYLLDVAREGNERGLRTTMVSAGMIERGPMVELCRELAAVKIDLKSMSDEFYRTNCSGRLEPVLDTIRLVKEKGVWLEVVYLVIPTLNDSEEEVRSLARWMREHVGRDVPLHFSRFHPQHRLRNLPPTPYDTLDRCHRIARDEGLRFVYVGNVPGHDAESTRCPGCKEIVIQRRGYRIGETRIRAGRCAMCEREIPGLWT